MPVEDLYKRFATNHIIRASSLEIITFATSTAMHLPTWVPDWPSSSSGWLLEGSKDKYNAMKESLASLQWTDIDLPRVSRCRSELMVQGKVLKTIQQRDYDALYLSIVLNLTHYALRYPLSEGPRKGDLICVLRGCSLLAYLRPVEQHYIMVGREWSAQDKLFLPDTGLITAIQTSDNKEQKTWKLKSIEDVQSSREEIFRIR